MGKPGANDPHQNWPISRSPDLDQSRAKPAGFENCAGRLVKFGAHCEHAHAFGYGYFCCHPNREKIIARMKAENKPSSAGA